MTHPAGPAPEDETPGLGAGLILLGWALVGWTSLLSNAPLLATLNGRSPDPGPAAMPIAILGLLTLGSLWLCLSGWRVRRLGLTRAPRRAGGGGGG
ncbi:hypothetical protein, partial [Frigidibacter sp. MR17.24]|uniref:hypothetical protein n=1 Tax=Frigidibacter sp. MR17.24 TaxID=3127345 RepID=UPI0030131A77